MNTHSTTKSRTTMTIEPTVKEWLKAHPRNKGWNTTPILIVCVVCALGAILLNTTAFSAWLNILSVSCLFAWAVISYKNGFNERVSYGDLLNDSTSWEVDDKLLEALADSKTVPDAIKTAIADKLKRDNALSIAELFEIELGYQKGQSPEQTSSKEVSTEGFKKMMAYARAEGSSAGNATTNS